MKIGLPPKTSKRSGLGGWIYEQRPETLALFGAGAIGGGWIALSLVVSIILPLLIVRFLWILGDLVQNDWRLPPQYRSYREYFIVLFLPFSKYPYRALTWAFTLALKSPKVVKRLNQAPPEVRRDLLALRNDMQIKALRSPMPTDSDIQRARDRALTQLRKGSPKAYRAFQNLDRKLDHICR